MNLKKTGQNRDKVVATLFASPSPVALVLIIFLSLQLWKYFESLRPENTSMDSSVSALSRLAETRVQYEDATYQWFKEVSSMNAELMFESVIWLDTKFHSSLMICCMIVIFEYPFKSKPILFIEATQIEIIRCHLFRIVFLIFSIEWLKTVTIE